MRSWKIFVPALLACLLVVPVGHAAKGDFIFGLQGGLSVPTGDYGDSLKSGFMGGVYGDYMVHEMFAIGVDASYNKNDGKELPAGDEVKSTIVQFGAHGKWVPDMKDAPVSPFVQLGAGLYNVKREMTVSSVPSDTTVNKFGFNLGAGLDYKATPQVSVGVFGNYHNISDAWTDTAGDKKSATYFTAGVRVTFMTTGATGGN
ncbi:MAG: porin family protein [Candidatus Eisenbacteria bacterium]|nr:porin family protein [Candidatus Eisenbacteria bacterium]